MAFLLGMLTGSLLIIACLRKKSFVREQSIEVLRARVYLCCFGAEGVQLTEGVSLPVCRIGSKFLRLDVLSDCLSG